MNSSSCGIYTKSSVHSPFVASFMLHTRHQRTLSETSWYASSSIAISFLSRGSRTFVDLELWHVFTWETCGWTHPKTDEVSDARHFIGKLPNPSGLYCYGCPFSWKLLFQDQEDSHEFVLSASSATEEKHWKMEILKCSASLAEMANPGPAMDPRKYSFMNLLLLPLDRVRFTTTSLARRFSMDSMTVSRKANVQHVIIKKTHCPHTSEEAASPQSGEGEFERAKTPVVRGALTLIARRMDRIRLERMIADVYNRDVLPMPGMVLGRGDLFRRGSIMRRLSLHAGFTKRSSSVSIANSGPLVGDTRSVEEYSVEFKEMKAGHDGFTDQQRSTDPECESPRSPRTPLGRSRTIRFRSSMKSAGSASSPRSEKCSSEESHCETPPPRKKWASPISLFNVLSPKSLKRRQGGPGTGY